MGLLDNLKASAEVAIEKARDAAEQGFEKAKDEGKGLQLKRELGKVRDDLGRRVVELANAGEISHPDLDGGIARANDLQRQIDDLKLPAEREEPVAQSDPLASEQPGQTAAAGSQPDPSTGDVSPSEPS